MFRLAGTVGVSVNVTESLVKNFSAMTPSVQLVVFTTSQTLFVAPVHVSDLAEPPTWILMVVESVNRLKVKRVLSGAFKVGGTVNVSPPVAVSTVYVLFDPNGPGEMVDCPSNTAVPLTVMASLGPCRGLTRSNCRSPPWTVRLAIVSVPIEARALVAPGARLAICRPVLAASVTFPTRPVAMPSPVPLKVPAVVAEVFTFTAASTKAPCPVFASEPVTARVPLLMFAPPVKMLFPESV